MVAILCSVFLVIASVFAVKAWAAAAVPSKQSFDGAVSDYFNDNKLTSYSFNQSQLGQIGLGMVNLVVGLSNPENPSQVLVPGAIPGMGRAIAFLMQERPAGTDIYLADLLQHAPLTKSAYAQGLGFQSLTPVLGIWKAMRDLTYLLYVIIFIIVGFMIMFRQKLQGGLVVTVESALPNLIVTLILITFSYAIAGLLIDVLYLTLYLIARIFEPLITLQNNTLVNIALTQDIFATGFGLVFNGPNGNPSVVQSAADAVSQIASGFFDSLNVADWLGDIGSGILGIIGALVFALAIFFAVVRTFFKLLEAYIGFILQVIFAPFQLVTGALTGQSTFRDWIAVTIANLAVFPVVVVMIFLALALGGSGNPDENIGYLPTEEGQIQAGFTPPLVTLRSGVGGQIAYSFQALVAIGILMLMPEALKMTREALKAQSPFDKYMPAISKGLETGFKGGELVPGLKFTNIPGASRIAGGTLKTTTGGLAGAAVGGVIGGSMEGIKGVAAGIPIGAAAGVVGPKRIVGGVQKVNKAVIEGAQFMQNVQRAPEALRGITQNRKLRGSGNGGGENDLGSGPPITG